MGGLDDQFPECRFSERHPPRSSIGISESEILRNTQGVFANSSDSSAPLQTFLCRVIGARSPRISINKNSWMDLEIVIRSEVRIYALYL